MRGLLSRQRWTLVVLMLCGAAEIGSPGLHAQASRTDAEASDSSKITRVLTVEYVNHAYRFRVALPDDWNGYSIVRETWGCGSMEKGMKDQSGPKITIRHPLWTETERYQDIPIMVFTKAQWRRIDNLTCSAAPVGPGKVGSNARYVFAVPPRYVGYTDDAGWREVALWMQTNPLRGY